MRPGTKRLAGILFCAAIMFSINGAWAYFTDQVEVENHMKTGVIKIDLKEYEKKEDGGEIPYQDPKQVMPGDQISKILRITNKEQSAYIRTKVEINFEEKELQGSLGIKDLIGIDEKNWIYRNGYFYYKQPVDSETSVDFFEGIKIPDSWDNHYANCSFSIRVEAQAVQAVHFQPDYEKENPWGDIAIEASAYLNG